MIWLLEVWTDDTLECRRVIVQPECRRVIVQPEDRTLRIAC